MQGTSESGGRAEPATQQQTYGLPGRLGGRWLAASGAFGVRAGTKLQSYVEHMYMYAAHINLFMLATPSGRNCVFDQTS